MEVIRAIYGYPPELYNCSNKTVEQWNEMGEKWPIMSIYLYVSGVIYLTLYIACMYAMVRMHLLKLTCYKIMFVLSIADIGNIMCASFGSGYVTSNGMVFCSDPFWMYILGAAIIYFWGLASVLYMILAINRVSYMMGIKAITRIFEAKGGLLWLPAALIYAFVGGIVMKPMPFSSKYFAAIYTPCISEDAAWEHLVYKNYFHPFNNITTFTVMFILYSIMCIFAIVKRSHMKATAADKRIFLQVILMSLPTAGSCLLYVLIQDAVLPIWVNVAADLCWQHCTGIASVIYLSMNREIRGFYLRKYRSKHSNVSVSGPNAPNVSKKVSSIRVSPRP